LGQAAKLVAVQHDQAASHAERVGEAAHDRDVE
jgi:hypothetical protein